MARSPDPDAMAGVTPMLAFAYTDDGGGAFFVVMRLAAVLVLVVCRPPRWARLTRQRHSLWRAAPIGPRRALRRSMFRTPLVRASALRPPGFS